MIILAIILLLIGSLVPLDPRAKNAMIITGVILLIVGAVLMFAPIDGEIYHWPFRRFY